MVQWKSTCVYVRVRGAWGGRESTWKYYIAVAGYGGTVSGSGSNTGDVGCKSIMAPQGRGPTPV